MAPALLDFEERESANGRAIETIEAFLHALVEERQRLRIAGADAGALERNRRAIVQHQWELAHALLRRYR